MPLFTLHKEKKPISFNCNNNLVKIKIIMGKERSQAETSFASYVHTRPNPYIALRAKQKKKTC